MSLASTIARPFKYVYRHRPRTGRPGVYGEGGFESGADPNNPAIMHYSDGQSAPQSTPYHFNHEFGHDTQATGQEAQPESNYLKLAKHLRELQSTPVRDENGRLRSGASQLRPTRANSLGEAIGQKVGQFLYGAIRPKADEEENRDEDIKRTYAQMGVEAQVEKEKREQSGQEVENDLRRAQTKYYNYRPQAEEDKGREASRRTLASVFNKLDEFDPSDPANGEMVDALKSAGLPIIKKERGLQLKMVQDQRTGAWSVIAGDKGTGQAASAPVKAPSGEGQLVTTPTTTITSEQKELDRKSREKIAAEFAALQGLKTSLSREEFEQRTKQFEATHPGMKKGAKPLKRSELDAAQDKENSDAQRQGRQPKDLRRQAVEQGYAIDEEN